jgi:hypothetical protein
VVVAVSSSACRPLPGRARQHPGAEEVYTTGGRSIGASGKNHVRAHHAWDLERCHRHFTMHRHFHHHGRP